MCLSFLSLLPNDFGKKQNEVCSRDAETQEAKTFLNLWGLRQGS